MIEIVMEVDDEFWNILNQLKEFKGQKVLIHCKDCIYWHECKTKDKFPYKKDSCNKFGTKMDADDFCSRGERK